MRRTVATLLLIAAGGLLVACGKSAYLGAGKHATDKTGSKTSTRSTRTITKARAETLAPTLNLQASDLPGFTVARERRHEAPVDKAPGRKLQRCMDADADSGTLAEASSKSFERHARIFHVSVSSSVTIVATPAQAVADVRAIGGDHARRCLTRFMRELLAAQTRGGVSERLVSISKATPPAAGTSGTFAWRITGELMLHEVKIRFYSELVGFARGQDEVQLLSFALPIPLPASAEQSLFSLLLARAKAGGSGKAGKGTKPPKESDLSGPRRVQISL